MLNFWGVMRVEDIGLHGRAKVATHGTMSSMNVFLHQVDGKNGNILDTL